MAFRTLDDMGDIAGKRVLVREDLNVPMADGGDRPDVRAAARQREAAEAARALAATAALPGFALRLNYSHQGEMTELMPGVRFCPPSAGAIGALTSPARLM